MVRTATITQDFFFFHFRSQWLLIECTKWSACWGAGDFWRTNYRCLQCQGAAASFQDPLRTLWWLQRPPNLLADWKEIDLSASVTAKLVSASVKMMFSETAIPNINQVSTADTSGK